ncbi:Rap guanine nucleotide exchange factor 1, partial [Schistosoma japonicum]
MDCIKSLDSRWSTLNIGGDYHNEDDNADNDKVDGTSKVDTFKLNRFGIMGYMYKFGVWDDQQPVLDPRLPIFLNSSIENTSNMNGTVIPTAPEWHHAELNRSGERKKGDNECGLDEDVKSKESEHEERSFDSTPKHLLSDLCVFDRSHLS